MDKEERNISVKNHMKLAGKVIYCYFLGLVMAWAGFPIISIFTMRNTYDGVSKNLFLPEGLAESEFFYLENIMSIYTGIVTAVLAVILYLSMHERGQQDLKPYKWSKYKLKGTVAAVIASVIIIIAEIIFILIADKVLIVAHPQLNIKGVHNYLTIALYLPFYWFYHLITPGGQVPGVTYITSPIPAVLIILFAGFGFFMGYSDKRLIKYTPKSKFIRRILYGKQPKE